MCVGRWPPFLSLKFIGLDLNYISDRLSNPNKFRRERKVALACAQRPFLPSFIYCSILIKCLLSVSLVMRIEQWMMVLDAGPTVGHTCMAESLRVYSWPCIDLQSVSSSFNSYDWPGPTFPIHGPVPIIKELIWKRKLMMRRFTSFVFLFLLSSARPLSFLAHSFGAGEDNKRKENKNGDFESSLRSFR